MEIDEFLYTIFSQNQDLFLDKLVDVFLVE